MSISYRSIHKQNIIFFFSDTITILIIFKLLDKNINIKINLWNHLFQ